MAKMNTKRINGFEIAQDLPPARPRTYERHDQLRGALVAAPVGQWLVVPIPETEDPQRLRNLILQNFRPKRTGWKIATKIDYVSRKLFVARIA